MAAALFVSLVALLSACRGAEVDHGPLDVRDVRPDLVFVTRSMANVDASGAIGGVLEERDDRLRLVADDGTDDVIAWPTGARLGLGVGMDPPVMITHHNADDPALSFGVTVGDTLRLHGGRAPADDPMCGCDGPVWGANGRVEVASSIATALTPPTPTTAEMGAFALDALAALYTFDAEEAPRVLLSRQLRAEEVGDLLTRFPQPAGASVAPRCLGTAATTQWFCEPEVMPRLVIMQGGWWQPADLGGRFVRYVGWLVDRRPGRSAMVGHGVFGACYSAKFGALREGVAVTPVPLSTLPTCEP